MKRARKRKGTPLGLLAGVAVAAVGLGWALSRDARAAVPSPPATPPNPATPPPPPPASALYWSQHAAGYAPVYLTLPHTDAIFVDASGRTWTNDAYLSLYWTRDSRVTDVIQQPIAFTTTPAHHQIFYADPATGITWSNARDFTFADSADDAPVLKGT